MKKEFLRFFLPFLSIILFMLACQIFSPAVNSKKTPSNPEKINPATPVRETLIPSKVIESATQTSPLLPKFLYVTYRENSMEIYGSQVDGSQVVEITTTDQQRNWNPAFSPDCKKIVYENDATGNMLLYIVELGSNRQPRLLTPSDIFTNAMTPSWSPDGKTIVFSGRQKDHITDAIFSIPADGSKSVQLTEMHPPGLDECPSWSPDGKTIAYYNTPTGADHILTLMDPDGSNRQALLTIEDPHYGCPSWSPDGSRLAFVIPGENDHGDIAIINRDGSGLVNLTNSEDQDWEPAWSPDGQFIAFMNEVVGDDFNIFVMRSDGSGKKSLFNRPVNEHQPAYCPIP